MKPNENTGKPFFVTKPIFEALFCQLNGVFFCINFKKILFSVSKNRKRNNESFLIANTGLMLVQESGYFVHNQKGLSHFDVTNDNFKVKFN